jgi:hypothetical protein
MTVTLSCKSVPRLYSRPLLETPEEDSSLRKGAVFERGIRVWRDKRRRLPPILAAGCLEAKLFELPAIFSTDFRTQI